MMKLIMLLRSCILEELKGGDYGDIEVIPGYILPTYENIENDLLPGWREYF